MSDDEKDETAMKKGKIWKKMKIKQEQFRTLFTIEKWKSKHIYDGKSYKDDEELIL